MAIHQREQSQRPAVVDCALKERTMSSVNGLWYLEIDQRTILATLEQLHKDAARN
jgi:hypothetical protein